MEQRHQEMITAISDLRADLRSEANARAIQPNEPLKTDTDASHSGGELDLSGLTTSANSAALPAALVSEGREQSPTGAGKKSFWSKLNPFGKSKAKNKQESAAGSPAQ
jgi:hypothetical protein